jgi:hypothetical protein
LAVAIVALTLAASAAGEICPNEQLRNEDQLSRALPDCRAYEQVSSVDKEDQGVEVLASTIKEGESSVTGGYEQPFQSAMNGDAAVYTGGSSAAGTGEFYRNVYVATRGVAGWAARDVSAVGNEPIYVVFSQNVDTGLLSYEPGPFQLGTPLGLGPELPEGYRYRDLYLRASNGSYVPLMVEPPPNRTPETFRVKVEGASADISHVIFEANDALKTTPTASAPEPPAVSATEFDLYEWSEGALRLVNVLPGNLTASPQASIAGGDHAVSSDGARIYWTDGGRLYLREGGERTFEVDASEGAGPGGGSTFYTASADGSRAFFTDSNALTSDAVEGSGTNLYEYQVEGVKHLTDLTQVADAGVQGVLGASENGSYVYFVATGDLAAGATFGADNLYLWNDGKLTFVAVLSFPEGECVAGVLERCANDMSVVPVYGNVFDQIYKFTTALTVWSPSLAYKAAEVSPNGRYLVFMSKASLTGYDNTRSGNSAARYGERVGEVYLYDAASNRVACASCIPDGARPVGESYLPPSENILYQPNYVTDEGRVFFDSQEALLPQDTDGATNVYEYEGGRLHLISDGAGVGSSFFDAASPSGDDVFFTTRQQLVPQDQDEQADLYDARVDGGFRAPAPAPVCEGEEECLGPFNPQSPALQLPASIVADGAGSVAVAGMPAEVTLRPGVKPIPKLKAKVKRKRERRARERKAGRKRVRRRGVTKSRANGSGAPGAGDLQRPVDAAPAAVVKATATSVFVAHGVLAVAHGALAPVSRALVSQSLGFKGVAGSMVEEGGRPDTQAGSHPYELTGTVEMNTTGALGEQISEPIREMEYTLPPGLVADRFAVPRCHQIELEELESCPSDSQIGWLWISVLPADNVALPIFNLAAPPNVPVEFGGELSGIARVFIDVTVRSDGTVVAHLRNLPDRQIAKAQLTLWGVPAAPSHTAQRCKNLGGAESPMVVTCGGQGLPGEEAKDPTPSDVPPVPFLSLPSSCGGPLTTVVRADTWENEGIWFEESFDFVNEGSGVPLALGGCERIKFAPSIEARPETTVASTPTGLNVDLRVPQNDSVGGLATAGLEEAEVKLPAGLAVSPSTLNGREACSEEEIGLTGPQSEAAPECPSSSKLASVEVVTPLLETPLQGALYLAQQGNGGAAQGSNPFGSLVAFYLVVEGHGVLIKLPGKGELDPATGQVTARFGEDPATGAHGLPQLPYNEFKLHFFGGPRAPLVTPSACGTYTTTSSLTPWSAPESGPPATPQSGFTISSGCTDEAFAPALTAGTTGNRAGAFSPSLVTTISRRDSEQDLAGVQLHMPPGLVGLLSKVTLCGEAQAQAGTCGPESELGSVTAAVGPGEDPFVVRGGKVYLTGPYNGAPFGLSIMVPAEGGPYKLTGTNGHGDIVVRAAIDIDPNTSALTITTEPLPLIVEGVPLQVKAFYVEVDRREFMINPTKCEPAAISATVQGARGAIANVSSPYQVAGCSSLKFTPTFSVAMSGRSSRVDGTSLDVKTTYPDGSLGTQANFHSVMIQIPKRLPARLTTLRRACLAATFEANPAACPPASVIGVAKVATPLLPVTLSGPIYFVSHGGEAYPSVVVVLQGDGVRADLTGSTFISKTSVTTSTFKSLPDVPFNSFEAYLPAGPYSAFAAIGDLCKSRLTMPTVLTAQNGAVIDQNTRIAVTGCPKAKAARSARRGARGRKASRLRTRGRGR